MPQGVLGWVLTIGLGVVALGIVVLVGVAIFFPNAGESEDERLERVAYECTDRYGAIEYPELRP
jgi:hypothetical protein